MQEKEFQSTQDCKRADGWGVGSLENLETAKGTSCDGHSFVC